MPQPLSSEGEPAPTRGGLAGPPLPAPARVRRLGDLLREVPASERALVLAGHPDALRRGDVTAVPLTDRRFSLRFTDVDGTPRREHLPDELVLVDEAFTAWLERQRSATRRALMVVTGEITLTEAPSRTSTSCATWARCAAST